MSITTTAPVTLGRRRAVRPWLLAIMVVMPISLALSWHSAVAVWRTGSFVNSDDAMRAVQIRDWMAGQDWYDLSAHRFGLPSGVFSHWSRIVDVPVSALIRLFGLAFPLDQAERAARIAYPVALQVALVAAMGYAGRVLAGAAAVVPAGLLIVLGGIGCMQFEPGRIHHHSPQIVLLTIMTAAALDALDPARGRRGALTGASVALSLAIGLENLPFIAVILAVPPVAWAVAGERQRGAVMWFAGGLATAAPALFAATVAPSRYAITSVDAFSLMHVVLIVMGAGMLVLAALWTPTGASFGQRIAVLSGIGTLLGGTALLLFPTGLHGPFFGMDPLLRPFWLDEVGEVRPLVRLTLENSGLVLSIMGPIVCGMLLTAAAWSSSRGLARARWSALVVLTVVGFAGSVWAVRVASSLQPLALLGGAWLLARLDARGAPLWRSASVLVLCSPAIWVVLPWPASPTTAEGTVSCLAAEAMAPLASLPTGTMFAPIDPGPFILAHTKLSVLAGPYHRDNAGNRAVIEGFLAPPAVARDIVRATGASYLAVCDGQTDLESAAAPGGLAAALRDGHVPSWLEPLALGATPIRVYAVH